MSKPLTRDEVETLRIWLMADSPARLHRISQRRIVADMLRLHDLMERLRNLQADDITDAQRKDWLNAAWYADRLPQMHAEMMATAVRVMLGGET